MDGNNKTTIINGKMFFKCEPEEFWPDATPHPKSCNLRFGWRDHDFGGILPDGSNVRATKTIHGWMIIKS